MSGARRRAAIIAASALAIAAAAVGVSLRPSEGRRPAAHAVRPRLLLLTSLPILFNEEFKLDQPASPALKALSSSFSVVPISVADGAELSKGGLLLMAQPFAQTPENLVALDAWVRRGGRVLLLADPLLEWPSQRALGDLTRPPLTFPDTGLLMHWGLRLEGPDRRGMSVQQMGNYRIATVSPGRLSGACEVRDQGLEARCRIGKGEAVIIADADFLNTLALGEEGRSNLKALTDELATLAHP